MTKKEVIAKIQEIKNISGDDEVAHAKEDILYKTFIEFVSKRNDKLGEIARILLSTKDIDFSRWCA